MDITVELLEKWNSCYTHNEHIRLFGDREYFTPLEIAEAEHLPAKDRAWVLLHEGIFTSSELRLFACDFAEYALSKIDNPYKRSIRAIEISRLYAAGKATESELAAAGYAAWSAASAARSAASAASDAARYAASVAASAASDAARSAASAASDAARYAARSAAWSAAGSAAGSAAYDHFLQRIKAKLEVYNGH